MIKVLNMMKRTGSILLSVTLLSGFFFMVTIKNTHAYIDVGSASLMFQMVIASSFGALFGLKIYWRSVVGKLSRFIARIKSTSTLD
jgi:hypothetical protein